MQATRVDFLASIHAAPVEEELAAIGICVLHRVNVKIRIHIGDSFRTDLVMPTAQRLRLYGPLALHPSQMIDDVDVKVVEAAPTRPDEAVESFHLVEQVGDSS